MITRRDDPSPPFSCHRNKTHHLLVEVLSQRQLGKCWRWGCSREWNDTWAPPKELRTPLRLIDVMMMCLKSKLLGPNIVATWSTSHNFFKPHLAIMSFGISQSTRGIHYWSNAGDGHQYLTIMSNSAIKPQERPTSAIALKGKWNACLRLIAPIVRRSYQGTKWQGTIIMKMCQHPRASFDSTSWTNSRGRICDTPWITSHLTQYTCGLDPHEQTCTNPMHLIVDHINF